VCERSKSGVARRRGLVPLFFRTKKEDSQEKRGPYSVRKRGALSCEEQMGSWLELDTTAGGL